MNLTNFFINISNIGDTKIMFFLTLATAIFLYLINKKIDSLVVAFSAAIAISITFTLKHLFKIPRPENMLVLEDGYRFPSGHATMAAVVATLVIYFTLKYLHSDHNKNSDSKNTYKKNINSKSLLISFSKYILCALAAMWLLTIACARLYLGVHLLVDVMTGAFIGIVSTIIIIKLAKHLRWFR